MEKVIAVEKSVLLKALSSLVRGVPNQPGAGTVRLAANSDLRLFLMGRNRDMEIVLPVSEPLAAPVELYLDGRKLTEVVGRLPAGSISLGFGKHLSLQAGSFTAQLNPVEPSGVGSGVFPKGAVALDGRVLCQALEAVVYATAREEYRAPFHGVQIELGSTFRVVASDGFRMAIYEGALPEPVEPQSVVCPREVVADILGIFAGGPVWINITPQRVTLIGEKARLAFAPISGRFPDYERVIPGDFVAEMILERLTLAAALQRQELIADKPFHRVDLSVVDGCLHLATSGDHGKAEEAVPIQALEGEAAALSFNAANLRQALGEAATVRLRLSGTNTPALVESVGTGVRAVVVPLRV